MAFSMPQGPCRETRYRAFPFDRRGNALAPKTHGYARRGLVPHIPATTARVCPKCDDWFAARSRETVCDGCVPPSVRTQRALKTPPLAHHTRPLSRAGERPGKRGVGNAVKHVYSEALGLNFSASLKDPRAADS